MKPWVNAAESARATTSTVGRVDGQLGQGHGEQFDMVGGGVRPGVARPQDPGQRFAGGVQEGEQRVMPEPALVGRRRPLLVGVGGDQRAVEVDHVERRDRRPPPTPDAVPSARAAAIRSSAAASTAPGCATPSESDATSPNRVGLVTQRRQIRDRLTAVSDRSPPRRPGPGPRSWPRRRCLVGGHRPRQPAVRPDRRPDRPADRAPA